MHRSLILQVLAFLLYVPSMFPQAADIGGEWQVTAHQLGQTQYFVLELKLAGGKLTGTVAGLEFECIPKGETCEGNLHRGTRPSNGKIKLTIRGAHITADGRDEDGPFDFVARRPPQPPSNPRTHQFTPAKFHNYFSSEIEPALHIAPGDTVNTIGVDAGGRDETGAKRAPGGNPLTGPFYIDGAWPGDTLAVKLNRVRLNRGTAQSGDQIVGSALAPYYLRDLKYVDDFPSAWTLDQGAGLARLAKPSEHLKNYVVALKPMLGCIGVAPPADNSFRSGFLGPWGGNMDYREFGEGTTVYLPVFQPGALLFLGDGHAAQGAGELTGDALETSMEISFTVGLLKGKRINQPRAENAEFRMASGIANSLPEAVQQATTNLSRWLVEDYKLSDNEVALVLGTAIHYDIAELVDPLVHVVAKIEKKSLAGLQQAP